MIDTLEIDITQTADSRLHLIDPDNIGFAATYSDHMFVADYADGKWQSPRIVPYAKLSLSPANATLHYAQSIFEGLKAYRTDGGEVQVFRADENARRMVLSAERMCLPPVPEELFLESINQLLSLDKAWVPSGEGESLYIRPFQFAMDPFIGVHPSKSSTFMVITAPAGAYYTSPVKVKIETEFTRAVAGGVGAAKTAGNYAASLYPTMRAQEQGYDQLIWTDAISHEYVEEAGTMNIMFVVDGKLLTPKPSDSILAGITRKSAVELAKDWGIAVEERRISVSEIIEAIRQERLQEAFGIGTAATVSPISMIGHDGIDFDLPILDDRLSKKIGNALSDIKLGRMKDKFGWMHKV